MDYRFKDIEKKWQKRWEQERLFCTTDPPSKPKYYVLSMFPYPSGEGLHVGHPMGYVVGDIYARYKKLSGYHVLQPMGFDAFGLPAEQYAIKEGIHPRQSTEENIKNYTEQLKRIGLGFDWDRKFSTSDPSYYKWTQWIFIRLFESYYCTTKAKAQPISNLEKSFEQSGSAHCTGFCEAEEVTHFSKEEWHRFSNKEREEILQKYRLAYLGKGLVNWSPTLGTVLANDEVKDGYSVLDGSPVEQKETQQWNLRITAYADRLLEGLDTLDWSDEMKKIQRDWIGKSIGAMVYFHVENASDKIATFTTRPDTLFGISYLTLAPEHPLVQKITTPSQKSTVEAYLLDMKKHNERDRISQGDHCSGVFTGGYALHPLTQEKIPVWISDYVLMGYGTGAVMAVPAHDERDYKFAKKFQLPIEEVVSGGDISKAAYTSKKGALVRSDFLNGLSVEEAIPACIEALSRQKKGTPKVNYRIRNAVFSRQRYWGEPIPVYYDEDGLPKTIPTDELPLLLPELKDFRPSSDGKPPLARAKNWKYLNQYPYEDTTMPAWAGSSWYHLRFIDPHNTSRLVSQEKQKKWGHVDLYVGGKEHATGHLLYSRFWHKFLADLDMVDSEEPFSKLVNQGMINHTTGIVHRIPNTNRYISYDESQITSTETIEVYIHSKLFDAETGKVDVAGLKKWQPEFQTGTFETNEDGFFLCQTSMYKMSKSKFNVVNPDHIIDRYGADALRMYEMFMGPIFDSKPWNDKGITGVFSFLHKFWKLFHTREGFGVSEDLPSPENLRSLHKTIEKVTRDLNKLSFNTCVSTFMICVNELTAQKCRSKAVLEPLSILIHPFAPHISEELWEKLGHKTSISSAHFPSYDPIHFEDLNTSYAILINGKKKFEHTLDKKLHRDQIEQIILSLEKTKKYLEGKTVKRVVVVLGKVVNIVS